MKKEPLLLLLLLLKFSFFGQTNASFKEIVAETNKNLSNYETINPYWDFDELFSIKDSDLPKHVIEEKYSGIDSILKEDMISEYIAVISDNIRAIFTHEDFQNYDVDEMLESDLLYIINSEDHKLYNITFDAKTGGTYRGMISLMFYFEEQETKEGGENTIIAKECRQYDIFEEDGYVDIDLIETKEGVKYILNSSVRTGSISTFGSIMLVKYVAGNFVREFYYTVHTEGPGAEISYHPDSYTIDVEYENDYLKEDCNCQNIEDLNAKQNDDPVYEDKVFEKQRCYCLFEFDGVNFVLKEQGEETIEEE
jgi:hypothetical protein